MIHMILRYTLIAGIALLTVFSVVCSSEADYLLAGQWGTSGTGNSQFSAPSGAAIDSSGNVYIADEGNNRIQKFDSTGNFLAAWGSPGSGSGQFLGPRGIAVDASGNIYVTDFHNHRVQKFGSDFTFLLAFGSSGEGDGQFTGPFHLALDAAGTSVYVTDSLNDRVQKFTGSGVFVTKWNGSGGTFFQPEGIAVDLPGNVYVVDSFNDRVQKFTSTGDIIAEWGTQGDGNGELFAPRGITVDTAGNVFVTDAGNVRVQKFSNTGNFLEAWGDFGSAAGEFLAPAGLVVNTAGNVYVVDSQNNRIQIFSTSVPAGPTNLSANEFGPSPLQVSLTWNDNSGNEDGFRIERAADNGPFLPLASVGANVTSYLDTPVAAFTTYSYQVYAFNTTGDSPPSNTATPPISPVRIDAQAYPNLTEAFAAVAPGKTLEAWGIHFNEPNITFNITSTGVVTFLGGYDTLYSVRATMTELHGSLTLMGAGALIVENLIIR